MRTALLALAMVGCTCEASPERESPPEANAATLSQYFPAALGDRWRFRDGDQRTTRSVTVREDDEAVLVGSDLLGPMRVRVTDEAVIHLGPDGAPVGDLLQTPLTLGHQWEYTLGDVRCEARYASMDEVVEVAGLTVQACIMVRRRCVHPAGKPFPEETTERHEETYCPFVGRVRETLQLDPAPRIEGAGGEGASGELHARRHDELVFYRVAGAPSPAPTAFDCDQVLVTAEDVGVACDRRVRMESATMLAGQCTIRFVGDGGDVTVLAQPGDDASTLLEGSEAREHVFVLTQEAQEGVAFVENGVVIGVTAASCGLEGLLRMEPLLRSLVRR